MKEEIEKPIAEYEKKIQICDSQLDNNKHLSNKKELAGKAVRRFRAKQKAAGLSELRRIYASPEERNILKLEIRKRLKELRESVT